MFFIKQKQKNRVYIRRITGDDILEVLAIENDSFEFPWSKENLIFCLRKNDCRGIVAEHEERVVGFIIYELCETRIQILNFATATNFLRKGIATQLVSKLISKLSAQRRTRICLEVRETNLVAQLFFRKNGFRAVSILREYYEDKDTTEDAYLMQYKYQPTPKEIKTYSNNRIAHLAG